MKNHLFISLFMLIMANHAMGQVDTIRKYYQSGRLFSEFTRKDGKTVGAGRYFYPNGAIKSINYFSDTGTLTQQLDFHKNGNRHLEWIGTNAANFRFKNYDTLGRLLLEKRQENDTLEIIQYHLNGKVQSRDVHTNGHEIGCIIGIYGSDSPVCYCYNKQVFWKDSFYVDSQGAQVNKDYTWAHTTYFKNGQKERDYVQKGLSLRKKEWNISGKVLLDTVVSIRVTPIIQNASDASDNVVISWEIEGGPILDSPNPLRDTVINSYTLTVLNDTSVLISMGFMYYDSLAQAYYEGIDVIGILVNGKELKKKHLKVNKCKNQYYRIDYENFVGIDKKRQGRIIFLGDGTFYNMHLTYDKWLDVRNVSDL